MSEYEPSRLACAVGLVCLGRQVLCARPVTESRRGLIETIKKIIVANNGLVFHQNTMRVIHEPTGGMMTIIDASDYERCFGHEYHHLIGGVHLRSDQRERAQTLVRLTL